MHKTTLFSLVILQIFFQVDICLAATNTTNALLLPVEENSISALNDSSVVIREESETADNSEQYVQQSFESMPLWVETYSEGGNLPSENNNLNGSFDLKIGMRFRWAKPVDIYSKLRVAIDRDHYFWNNRYDIGIGSRIHIMTNKASLLFLAEGSIGRFFPDENIRSRYNEINDKLNDRTAELDRVIYKLEQDAMASELDLLKNDSLQKHVNELVGSAKMIQSSVESLTHIADSLMAIPMRLVKEVRAGFVFWKGWGESGSVNDQLFPLRFWGDLYGEVIFIFTQRQIEQRGKKGEYQLLWNRYINTICAISPKIGLVLMNGPIGSIVGYGRVNSLIDLRGDWYNNLGSLATGVRYKPFSVIDLSVFGEYDTGIYWGRQYKDDINPNKSFFSNVRFGFNFWYGLGNI